MQEMWSCRDAVIPLHAVCRSRAPVVSPTGALVASSSPMATDAGVSILRRGGNAADAAVAVAAALSVVEPCSTGCGGDCFCLYYSAADGAVSGVNGSGRSPRALTPDTRAQEPPPHAASNVTVPGAIRGWLDTYERFGSGELSFADLLQPAISLARTGFCVTPVVAHGWKEGEWLLSSAHRVNPGAAALLPRGRAPRPGELVVNADVASTLGEVAARGPRDGFYTGRVAAGIVEVVRANGGLLHTDDLAHHQPVPVEPIHVDYRGRYRLWELPPNTQGMVALIAVGILDALRLDFTRQCRHNTAPYIHYVSEALRMAFIEASRYITDPELCDMDGVRRAISAERALVLAGLIRHHNKDTLRVLREEQLRVLGEPVVEGTTRLHADTVYFTVTDKDGNACSFINSNYQGFGTGLVPRGCGFTLQNRGANFDKSRGAAVNGVAGGRRPYHTIIPAMITDCDADGKLLATFGVMGGFMQPQGHVQVMLNLVEFSQDPQWAVDSPRFCIEEPFHSGRSVIAVEDGVGEDVVEELARIGHQVRVARGWDRTLFGRGQCITRGDWWRDGPGTANTTTTAAAASPPYWAGSDHRTDGSAQAIYF